MNQRGIALIVTLLVVTLLSIAVVEFTFAVQVDQRLVKNSLSAMQAALLARSGVNLGEAVLAQDTNDPQADSYQEDWAHIEAQSVITLESDQRLAIRVLDESGKININRTRPRPGPTPAPNQASQQPNLTPDAFLRDAMRAIFQREGILVDVVDRLHEYWKTVPTPIPGAPAQQVPDFRSLEDFGALFGIPASKLTRVKPYLTALPVQPGTSSALSNTGLVNVNTAEPLVLQAILQNAQEKVQEILDRRDGEEPILKPEVNKILTGVEGHGALVQVFGVSSSFYRILASAAVNTNPLRDGGGVGQTVEALVFRRPKPGVPATAPPGTARWTLTPIDWQKRGGAELLVRSDEEREPGDNRLRFLRDEG
jgi:general secretion pathway protein K